MLRYFRSIETKNRISPVSVERATPPMYSKTHERARSLKTSQERYTPIGCDECDLVGYQGRYCLPGVGVEFIDISPEALRKIEREVQLYKRPRFYKKTLKCVRSSRNIVPAP